MGFARSVTTAGVCSLPRNAADRGDDGSDLLQKFGAVRIDADALAAQLQEEGAKSFVQSWNDLMKVIASKSAALAAAG